MTSSSKQVFFDQRDYPFDNVRRVNPPRSLLFRVYSRNLKFPTVHDAGLLRSDSRLAP